MVFFSWLDLESRAAGSSWHRLSRSLRGADDVGTSPSIPVAESPGEWQPPEVAVSGTLPFVSPFFFAPAGPPGLFLCQYPFKS